MLQALLADRFSVKLHREMREVPVYAIVLGKPPLKLRESLFDPNSGPRIEALVNIIVNTSPTETAVNLGYGSSYTMRGGKFEGKRLSPEMLASTFERYSDRPVVDMTGLRGVYDVSFEVTPEDSQILGIRAALYAGVTLPEQVMKLLDTGGEPLIGAMQQLGLKPRIAGSFGYWIDSCCRAFLVFNGRKTCVVHDQDFHRGLPGLQLTQQLRASILPDQFTPTRRRSPAQKCVGRSRRIVGPRRSSPETAFWETVRPVSHNQTSRPA